MHNFCSKRNLGSRGGCKEQQSCVAKLKIKMLVGLKRIQVPNFLRGSEFYNSLQADDDEQFFIDSLNFVEDDKVASDAQLLNLLHTLRFWGVDVVPDTIIDYVIHSDSPATYETVRSFEKDFLLLIKGLSDMEGQDEHQFLEVACRSGNVAILPYFLSRKKLYPVDEVAVLAAAESGHIPCLQMVHNLSCMGTSSKLTQKVVEHGHLDCLQFLLTMGCKLDKKASTLAARHGHIECLKFLYARGCTWDSSVCKAAIIGGHVACLEYAHENGCQLPKDAVQQAIEHDHVDCLEFCLQHGGVVNPKTSSIACEHGSLKILTYMHQKRQRIAGDCEDIAALHGHLNCIQYLYSVRQYWCGNVCTFAVRGAISNPERADACLACFKFALENGCRCSAGNYDIVARNRLEPFWRCLCDHGVMMNEFIIRDAISRRDFECIVFAHQLRSPVPANACELALFVDDVRILRYLHEQANVPLPADACTRTATRRERSACLPYLHERGCEFSAATFSAAARAGCVENLQYLHQHGCPLDVTVTAAAAGAGMLSCLQYLHKASCPWDASACEAAAKGGALHCLQYLRENGCPWDEQVVIEAINGCKKEIFMYALEQGCPHGVMSLTAAATVSNTEYKFLQRLYERGCSWDERVCAAAATCAWNATNLQYLHEHGCPWDATTCTAAVKAHHIDCLRYAHEHGCTYEQNLCLLAASSGAYDCLVYAHKRLGCPLSEQVSAAAASAVYFNTKCLLYVVEEGCPVSAATMRVYNEAVK